MRKFCRCGSVRAPALVPLVLRACFAGAGVLTVTGCGGANSAAATRTDTATALVAVAGLDNAVPPDERASGTVTVSATTPATGDGDVHVVRRVALELPGASSAFSVEGVSGPLAHTFLITFDDAGAIRIVTHKWSNADNSIVAQTDCGSRQPCPPSQVSADPNSRTVTFRGLELTGLDGNTAASAHSTLTGAIR